MKHSELLKWLGIAVIISALAIGFYFDIQHHLKPVVIGPSTVAVYDSLKNVIAYKEKNRWIILQEQGTLLTLEKEIYRLNAIAGQMEKINQRLKVQNDSLTLLIKKK